MPLKIIFAGTPEFAVPSLQTLLQSHHQVIAVYTQPDRPAGRGQQLHASPVKQMAESHNIPIFQPNTLRDIDVQNQLRELKADVMVVAAYGLILPEAVLVIPTFGCINLHPSLLPRWRGAAPIQRMLEAGDVESGMTIMQMNKGMDTGAILKQQTHLLHGDETAAELHDLYSYRGAELLLSTLDEIEHQLITPIAQIDSLATIAPKIEKSEAIIDWTTSAKKIADKIRAFNSWPVAQTTWRGAVLRIWQANVIKETPKYPPGFVERINHHGLCVATADGLLEVITVQLPGKKAVSVTDFLHGYGDEVVIGRTQFGKK